MQKLYRVKSTYYLPQVHTNFEYHWFVYKRVAPILSYNQVVFQLQKTANLNDETPDGANLYFEIGRKNQSQPELISSPLGQQLVDELFTFEEACQLQLLLEGIFKVVATEVEVTTTIEEVTLPFTNTGDDIRPLRQSFKLGGHYVDPFDFAAIEGNCLKFLVGAAVTGEVRYVAEDFLRNLSPARLAALRQMHAENNG